MPTFLKAATAQRDQAQRDMWTHEDFAQERLVMWIDITVPTMATVLQESSESDEKVA